MCRDGRGGGRGVNDKMHKKQIRTYFFETKMKWPLWKDTWVNLQNGLNLFYKPNLLISAGDNSYFPGPIPLWYLPTQTMFTMIPYSLFDISRYSAKICFFSFYSMIYKHTCRYSSLETSSLRSSGSLSGGVKTWLKKYIFVTSFKLLCLSKVIKKIKRKTKSRFRGFTVRLKTWYKDFSPDISFNDARAELLFCS